MFKLFKLCTKSSIVFRHVLFLDGVLPGKIIKDYVCLDIKVHSLRENNYNYIERIPML